jgi:hydrogenase maturation protease
MSNGVLVAGIGNVFQSDDAFGVEVASRLSEQSLPTGARVEDFGIRGVHLAYELLGGYDGLVIIDALPMGEPPGTLAIIEPEPDGGTTGGGDVLEVVDAHTMSPDVVLGTLHRLGGSVEKIFVIGCQPANLHDGMGLSPAVAAAVDDAAEMCRQLVSELLVAIEKGVHP